MGRRLASRYLGRRYLKKDAEEKVSHLRVALQKSLIWLKEKLPERQTAVSATEVAAEQVVNEEGRSLGVSSPIVLQHAEQPEVKNDRPGDDGRIQSV